MKKNWLWIMLVLILWLPLGEVRAQSETPTGPVYIVQEGDFLSSIAQRFGVTIDDLIALTTWRTQTYSRLATN